MRVLQLIDSLEAGGAERVAVNIANALKDKIDKSYIVATRKEGVLKNEINAEVEYFFLDKKKTLDSKAVIKLIRYVKTNKVDIIHAHSSSFFIASLIKLLMMNRVKLVWHLHYGGIKTLAKSKLLALKLCSNMFNYTFTVNNELEIWVRTFLKQKNITYLPNFPVNSNFESHTSLKGQRGKRIVCLANLRYPKDHNTLIKAFRRIVNDYSNWTLHLVGKDLNDSYSINLKQKVKDLNLCKNVFFYGSCQDVSHILKQATLGVLSSESEGLPLSLLEYGLAGLPVVVTNVGECAKVIGLHSENGIVVPAKNVNALAEAIRRMIADPQLRKEKAHLFNTTIRKEYSKEAVLTVIISKYKFLFES